MINLSWTPFPGADVVSYNVYRSIIGFKAPIVSLASGLTLILAFNGGSSQTFIFDGVTAIVDLINATAVGGRAFVSYDGLSFFVRSNVRDSTGTVQIVGGTALTALGLTAHTIGQKTEAFVIANIAALSDPTLPVTYVDQDGAIQDWYAVSSINSFHSESTLTAYIQPIQASGSLCVIEGIAVNLQGARVADVTVTAKIINLPQGSGSTTLADSDPVTVQTGTDGRFSLPVLQGVYIQLDIPDVGFSKPIKVPCQSYVFINDLAIDTNYRYPTGTYGG